MKIIHSIVVCLITFLFCSIYSAGSAMESAGRDLALCVGINNYVKMGKLKYCVNDAYAVMRRLEESQNFRKVTVVSDIDENGAHRPPSFQPTENIILDRLTQMARLATPADRLFFFFSGHGIERDGESWIIPIDGGEAEAISLDVIKSVMADSRARNKLMIIDACRSRRRGERRLRHPERFGDG